MLLGQPRRCVLGAALVEQTLGRADAWSSLGGANFDLKHAKANRPRSDLVVFADVVRALPVRIASAIFEHVGIHALSRCCSILVGMPFTDRTRTSLAPRFLSCVVSHSCFLLFL